METMDGLNIRLSFSRKSMLPLLALGFLCWHPGFIGSESLTLTTYYPAPYGGYVSLLTTGQTLLARDGGNVGVGPTAPQQKLHVSGGNVQVDGNAQAYRIKFPGVGGNSGVGGDYYSIYQEAGGWSYPYPDLRIQYHTGISYDAYRAYGGHRFYTDYDGSGNPAGLEMQITHEVNVTHDLRVGGDLYVTGRLVDVCTYVGYGVGATAYCPGGRSIVGFRGDGVPRVSGFLPGGSTTSAWGTYIILGEDWGGTMACCRLF